MTYKTVFQKTLSTKIGVYNCDYIDIHTKKEYFDAKIKLKNKSYSVGIFISNEGYGHSVRQKNIIIELINKYPKSSFTHL